MKVFGMRRDKLIPIALGITSFLLTTSIQCEIDDVATKGSSVLEVRTFALL